MNERMTEAKEIALNHNSFAGDIRRKKIISRSKHFCFFGVLHLENAMKFFISIGMFFAIVLCILEAIWIRRAICVMIIPISVVIVSALAIFRRRPLLLWPIIGISFFHLFLDAYATIVFLFFLIFKPLYIIMVLNWAFDNMHPNLAPYYPHCFVICSLLVIFFLFNFWQLRISLRFQTYLDETLVSSASRSAGSRSLTNNSNMLPSYIDDRHQPQLENNNEPALFSEHEINKELTVNIFGKQTSFNSLGKNYTGKIALSPSIRRAVIFAQSSRTPTPVFISGGRRSSLGGTSKQYFETR